MTQPDSPKTLEDAFKIIQDQARLIGDLQRQIEELKKEIEELKKNQPKKALPHFVKPNVERENPSKRGPPRGHPFFDRHLPDIDEEKEWSLESCPDCGEPVSRAVEFAERTEVDIPPVKPVVRRHRIGRHWCRRCKKIVSPRIPTLLPHTPYGMNLHLQVAHLKYGLGLTMDKIRALLSELYGLSLSSGVISAMLGRVGKRLKAPYDQLKDSLPQQELLNVDETGWRVAGISHWLWSFSSPEAAYYRIERSRGKKVVADVLGTRFDGILVTDFYSSYHAIEAVKQKCWVHVLRDIKKIQEDYTPLDKRSLAYAKVLKAQIRSAITIKNSWDKIEAGVYRERVRQIQLRLAGLLDYPPDQHALKTLAKRLKAHRKDLFVFLERKEVPFHNNDAERQIRPCVLMRKTSYQNASDRGALTQAIVMSVIQTCRKRKLNFFEWTRRYLEETGPPGSSILDEGFIKPYRMKEEVRPAALSPWRLKWNKIVNFPYKFSDFASKS